MNIFQRKNVPEKRLRFPCPTCEYDETAKLGSDSSGTDRYSFNLNSRKLSLVLCENTHYHLPFSGSSLPHSSTVKKYIKFKLFG